MIPIQKIRAHKEELAIKLKKKNFSNLHLLDEILTLDDNRKSTQRLLDELLAQSNQLSKQIPILMKDGKKEEAETLKIESANLKSATQAYADEMRALEKLILDLHAQIPNIPHDKVGYGKSAEDNTTVRTGGEIPNLIDGALPHWELTKKYDIIDFDLGVKLTGAGFPVYKGKGAKLERALIQYFLDKATEAGYLEIIPPLMVNEESAFATGQLPDKEGQMYQNHDGFYMIPTAEVPVTNIYRDTVSAESDLPIKLTAYSQCFRREAGSYGKDVRGLNRLHQFDKVEIVQLVQPDTSYDTLETMTSHVESLLIELGLPYRVLLLCGGDMSFASAFTYDLEVYSAAQEKWLEVSSVSNFEDFQANRLKARFKNGEGKIELCHTLNGSALALPRIVAALLENNQTEKGIRIPQVLVPYTKFEYID
ncbi:MAG: serine--tRNA ligase [Chitinophagales bacterium]|jgi:seryl-tRNA synthetase|nr:serine--tRNA ligase [Sphingobacteriales bacterium]